VIEKKVPDNNYSDDGISYSLSSSSGVSLTNSEKSKLKGIVERLFNLKL